jgi:hypothetical protein
MPTTQRALRPSAGNETLGGVPEILYFDLQSRGRGQAVRLLLEDAQIAYDDTRYSFQEYPEWRETGLVELNPVKTVPVVKLNEKNLTQSYAILRYFAKILKSYDGKTPEEQYWVDALCDIVSDCKLQTRNIRLSSLTVDLQGARSSSKPFLILINRKRTPNIMKATANAFLKVRGAPDKQ